MSRVLLTWQAWADLRQIAHYIARDSASAARRVVRELRAAMERLADMPGMGHLHEDLADESLRVWVVYAYLIVYRPRTNPLQVVRVVSGHRDLSRLFGSASSAPGE